MRIFLSAKFQNKYKKLIKRDNLLKHKVKEKIKLFKLNPVHSSLKLHRLKGRMVENWSFSVEQDLRIIFTYVKDGVLFVDVGKHEDVY